MARLWTCMIGPKNKRLHSLARPARPAVPCTLRVDGMKRASERTAGTALGADTQPRNDPQDTDPPAHSTARPRFLLVKHVGARREEVALHGPRRALPTLQHWLQPADSRVIVGMLHAIWLLKCVSVEELFHREIIVQNATRQCHSRDTTRRAPTTPTRPKQDTQLAWRDLYICAICQKCCT